MAIVVSMPKSGPTIERAVIGCWEKKVGDKVAKGDILFTFETDKTSYECKSQADGVLLEIFYEEGDEVAVFTNVCVIGNEGEDITEFRPESKGEISTPEEETDAENENAAFEELSTYAKEVRISPRAKKLAKEKGIDASIAKASGPCGRIIEKDIINLAKSAADTYRVSTVEYEDVKLSGIRRTISKTMHSSLATMAQLTHNMSFDASEIIAYRKRMKEQGTGITLGDIVLFAVCRDLFKCVFLVDLFLFAYLLAVERDIAAAHAEYAHMSQLLTAQVICEEVHRVFVRERNIVRAENDLCFRSG